MSTNDWPNKIGFATLSVLCAFSINLYQAPAAHANGITDKVKGAFVSTGEALKKTARVGGEAIMGTAHAGGAAAVYTGKAVGTTAGAVAGATGELVSGSAKALETSSEATVNATGELLGMKRKPSTQVDANANQVAAQSAKSAAPAQTAVQAAAQTAKPAAQAKNANATADGAVSTAPPSVRPIVKQIAVPARAATQAPAASPTAAAVAQPMQTRVAAPVKTTLAPLPKGNTSSVSSSVARGTINGTDTQTAPRAVAPVSTAAAAAAAPVKQAVIKPVKQPKVQATAPVARMPLNTAAPASDVSALDAAAMEVVRDQKSLAGVSPAAPGKGAPSAKISKKMREEMLKANSAKPGSDMSEMTAAQELQALAPAQISNDITEGTRISAPVEDSYVAPSWNQQQPVTTSAAYAQQYSLHTTPLKAAPSPGQPVQAK